MCAGPESFPMKSWHRESSAGNSTIAVFPVKSIGARFIPAIIAFETAVSVAVPNKITSASDSAINRFAISANRSGNQHFADPYDAQYLNTTPEELQKDAAHLAKEGLLVLDADFATPTQKLAGQSDHYRAQLDHALALTKPEFNEEMRHGHTNM